MLYPASLHPAFGTVGQYRQADVINAMKDLDVERNQLKAAETLKRYEQIVRDMQAAEQAHKQTNLNNTVLFKSIVSRWA